MRRLRSPNAALNRYDACKIAALVAMTLDHVAFFLAPDMVFFRVIGRAAMPLFGFLIGYNGSYRFRLELAAGAAALTALQWATGWFGPLNILWTILLCRVVLQHMPHAVSPWQATVHSGVILAAGVPLAWLVDYGGAMLLWALAGRAHRQLPASSCAIIYATAAGAMSAGHAWLMFTQQAWAQLAGMLVIGGITIAAMRFRLRPWRPPFARAARIASHYALEYYLVHFALLVVFARGLRSGI